MAETRVLYNESCPICSREIKHYARLAEDGDLPLAFDGLGDAAADWGIEAETAAKRIHVQQGDRLLVGVPAFLAMWAEIPRYRWLAKVVGAPVIRPIVTVIYDWILAPVLYAMHKRRVATNKALTQRHN